MTLTPINELPNATMKECFALFSFFNTTSALHEETRRARAVLIVRLITSVKLQRPVFATRRATSVGPKGRTFGHARLPNAARGNERWRLLRHPFRPDAATRRPLSVGSTLPLRVLSAQQAKSETHASHWLGGLEARRMGVHARVVYSPRSLERLSTGAGKTA